MWLLRIYAQACRLLNEVVENEEGQGMVEYGLILALIAVVVIAALTLLGDHVAAIFDNIAGTLEGVGD